MNGRDHDDVDDRDQVGATADGPTAPGAGGDAGSSPRALPLVLAVLGMILIPLGLIALYVAFTSGNDSADVDTTPATAPPATSALAVPSPLLAGRWNVLAGPDSWVGYTVNQIVPRVPAPAPVSGRTQDVTGGIVIDASGTVVAAAINVELATMRTTDADLDAAMQVAGLETDTYPYATFVLTNPIALPNTVVTGQPFDVTAQGDFTLHGVTQPVSIPLRAELLAGDPYRFTLEGKADITLSDYGIPLGGSTDVVRFQDDAVITLHLMLTRLPDEVAGLSGSTTSTRPSATPATGR